MAAKRITWMSAYSVHVEELDEQHKHLVVIYNNLVRACAAGQEEGASWAALRELTDYTEHHFTTEENYMNELGFPGAAAHKREHDHFRNTLRHLTRHVMGRHPQVTDELLTTIWEWLNLHTLHPSGYDQQYAQFAGVQVLT